MGNHVNIFFALFTSFEVLMLKTQHLGKGYEVRLHITIFYSKTKVVAQVLGSKNYLVPLTQLTLSLAIRFSLNNTTIKT
jgi:hypothetical protein